MGGTRRSARQLTRCVDEGQGTMVVEGGRRPALWSQVMAEAWREALSDAEVRELLEMRDWRSWLSIAVDWGTIGIALALVARWPNPLTVVVALFVIGGRQLGLAVLMHEAAHRTLFRERRLNDLVGNWLCAYPVWSDLYPYRPHHLPHHAKTCTENHPDLPPPPPFPATRTRCATRARRSHAGGSGCSSRRIASIITSSTTS